MTSTWYLPALCLLLWFATKLHTATVPYVWHQPEAITYRLVERLCRAGQLIVSLTILLTALVWSWPMLVRWCETGLQQPPLTAPSSPTTLPLLDLFSPRP